MIVGGDEGGWIDMTIVQIKDDLAIPEDLYIVTLLDYFNREKD